MNEPESFLKINFYGGVYINLHKEGINTLDQSFKLTKLPRVIHLRTRVGNDDEPVILRRIQSYYLVCAEDIKGENTVVEEWNEFYKSNGLDEEEKEEWEE